MTTSPKAWQKVVADGETELLTLLPWILKDLGWLLLLHPLAFGAAAVALVADVARIVDVWPRVGHGLRMFMLVETLWLVGNMIWMSSELFFFKQTQPAFSDLPWSTSPLFLTLPQDYDRGVALARAVLLASLAALVLFFVGCSVGVLDLQKSFPRESLATSSEGLIFGFLPAACYKQLFIAPWIVKDLCWTAEMGWGVFLFGVVVLVLGADCVRRFRCSVFVVELLWFCGNAVWAYSELYREDSSFAPRGVAALMLSLGVGAAVMGIAGARSEGRCVDEQTALI